MRQLLPTQIEEVSLAGAYAVETDDFHVRAVMIASVDGAATLDGVTGGLSGPMDRAVLRELRNFADAVLVGAETVRAERYGPLHPRQTERGRVTPTLAIVSNRLHFDPEGPLPGAGSQTSTVVFTSRAAPEDKVRLVERFAEVVVAGETKVELGSVLNHLAARGMRHVLCEGGPSLLGSLVAQGLVDELCLTVSPQLLSGDMPRILSGVELSPPKMLTLLRVFEEDGFLFLRYALQEGSTGDLHRTTR